MTIIIMILVIAMKKKIIVIVVVKVYVIVLEKVVCAEHEVEGIGGSKRRQKNWRLLMI